MAGRRSKKMMEEMAVSAPVEAILESPVEPVEEAVSAAPAPVSGPVDVPAFPSREAELEAEIARLKAVIEALSATSKEAPVIDGWPESVVPRRFEAGYKGEFVVNPSGARGVMVLEGTLFVAAPSSANPARLAPGGYAMIAKGQPHALEAGPTPVRAVFVESSNYGDTLEKYNPATPVAAIPAVATAQSWAESPASVHSSSAGISPQPSVPSAPIPVAVQSKAVTQLLEMRHARGRRGFEVRHPNDRVPVPAQPSPTQSAGLHPSGAPMPVADGQPSIFTGDGLVR